MADTVELVARGIEPEVVAQLEERAAAHGVSPEEEHRQILRDVLLPATEPGSYQKLKELLFEMPNVGEDSDFERDSDLPRAIDLS